MVEITGNFRKTHAGAIKKARTERIRCVRLESDLFYIARREAGHGRYIVKFIEEQDGSITAECRRVNGWRCQGTLKQGSCCVHIASAHERAVQHGFRINRQEAA